MKEVNIRGLRCLQFYDIVCKIAGVEKITPENRGYVSEVLRKYAQDELGEIVGMNPQYATLLRALLTTDPYPRSKRYLKAMYQFAEKDEVTTRHILDFLQEKNLNYFYPLSFLEKLGVIKIKGREGMFTSIEVDREIMLRYWPGIEGWDHNKKVPVIRESKVRRQRIEEVLMILGKSSLDELYESDIKNIKSLSRVDWAMGGIETSRSTLTRVKHYLLSCVTNKLKNI